MSQEPEIDKKPKSDQQAIHWPTLWESTKKWYHEMVDLEDGMDVEGTIISIKNNRRMRGANAWLLMCSIMIASLGLDLNSVAVIIGAMLISPLMSPILGVGLGIGINDRDTLVTSLTNFGIAILIALFTSIIYFKITPLGELTPEILSRTKPTLLDGMVAIFGGLAGIISVSRKDQSNAIPGVAIATALMPPLCVSGFGIATGNFKIFFNSFYLFFLNSFFIAITTYFVVRWLNFPYKTFVNDADRRKTRLYIGLVSLLLVLPSSLILFNLWEENIQNQEIKKFVSNYFGEGNNPSQIAYSFNRGDEKNQLIIKLIGDNINEEKRNELQETIRSYNRMDSTDLLLIQDSEVGINELKEMETELSSFKVIANMLDQAKQSKSEDQLVIEALEARIDSIFSDTIPFNAFSKEAMILFPAISNIGIAKAQLSNNMTDSSVPVLLLDWKRSHTRANRQRDEKKLYDFAISRTGLDTLKIIAY